jgi:PII-like signaling protein
MQPLSGEHVLMRIHISEGDRCDGGPHSERILGLIRARRLAGATILRGAMSFGANSRMHSDRVEILALDLPLVIECVETEENIRTILPEIDKMIGGGLVTLERVNVALYRHGDDGGGASAAITLPDSRQ